MSNFDFLKKFNNELYEIGNKLEEDVITSPRAVPADATLFLEILVKDIYKISNLKLKSEELPFYQKIDFLYRSKVITYIYKNKLQDAYNIRNKIHTDVKKSEDEVKIAFDLHQRLYYISKKYFLDFSEINGYIKIPDYKKPTFNQIHFDNCIICGSKNLSLNSNMCSNCNAKIETANYIISLKNSLGDSKTFLRDDLTEYGLSESESLSIIMDLTKDNLIFKKGDYYVFNDEEISGYIDNVNQYINIGLLLNKFYKNEITTDEIKKTIEYWKGSKSQKPCVEFYNLVNEKIEKEFEKTLIETQNINTSIKKTGISSINLKAWFQREKEWFVKGSIKDAFITFNELLIDSYFDFKKRGFDEMEIRKKLKISNSLFQFWVNDFSGEDFLKKTSNIKKELIIRELKKDKNLKEILKSVGMSKREFDKLLTFSKKENTSFYRDFKINYTQKRQNLLVKNLRKHKVYVAIKRSKITKSEFYKWYFDGEIEYSDFYLKTTEILMGKYLKLRKKGLSKSESLELLELSKDFINSWLNHDDLDLFNDFKVKNNEITSNLLKRGLIINALKEDKSKSEAIASAKITLEEFNEIYETSRKEKSDFYLRFDVEYGENRKRHFVRYLEKDDFYNAILKLDISQKEFNKWYARDESKAIKSGDFSEFYIKTTELLMDKYIKSRKSGKNRPDAARSVGLSNIIIDRWMKHSEIEMFSNFNRDINRLYVNLIVSGFKESLSKKEISQTYDISLKTIEKYIADGENGNPKYEELFNLYESRVIPKQIDVFLEEIQNKPFKKALKKSKFSENDLNYFYLLGKKGNEKYKKFYNEYLNLKFILYAQSILSKKSHKIALKNSNLSSEEFEENKDKIEDIVFEGRMDIFYDTLIHNKFSAKQLSSNMGVDMEELYEWYFKGMDGEVRFKEFILLFQAAIIAPKLFAFKKAESMGFPKNKLMKQIKRTLGTEEFKIWQKYDIFNHQVDCVIDLRDEDINHFRVRNILSNYEHVKKINHNGDLSLIDSVKKAFNNKLNFKDTYFDISNFDLNK